jgi:hypothetical protein
VAKTSLSSLVPYLLPARLWLYRDERPVLELLADDDTIPAREDAEDNTTGAGARLYAALQRASGDVERYAAVGEAYLPVDLAALTGNQKALLESLVADLAFWALARRRWPAVKPEEVSGVREALDALKDLRDGVTIFGTVGSADAGLPDTVGLDLVGTTNPTTVSCANRFFGSRNRDGGGCGGTSGRCR